MSVIKPICLISSRSPRVRKLPEDHHQCIFGLGTYVEGSEGDYTSLKVSLVGFMTGFSYDVRTVYTSIHQNDYGSSKEKCETFDVRELLAMIKRTNAENNPRHWSKWAFKKQSPDFCQYCFNVLLFAPSHLFKFGLRLQNT